MTFSIEKRHELRLLTPQDMPQALHIWSVCFGDSQKFIDWYFETSVTPERAMGLFEGGKLISDTLMLPYSVRLREKTAAAPYIAGAATLPEHRKKGHMERVLKAALAHMREMGADITFLHPFRYGFYRRLGWECATGMLRYTLPADRLKALCEPGDFAPVEHGFGRRHWRLYHAMAERADPALLRGVEGCEKQIEETLLEGGFGLWGAGAYALCRESEGNIHIHELVYGQTGGIFPLLGSIARMPGAKTVSFRLPGWEAPPPLFADEEPPALTPYMMMRVVDTGRALSGLQFPKALNGAMTLSVTDALCPWNEGVFRVELKDGLSKAERVSGDFDAAMDITALSMLLAGYTSYSEAAAWGLLRPVRENGLPGAAFTRLNGFILEKY